VRDEELFNRFGHERIESRQIDELVGLARGLCADEILNQAEVEFLHKWLAANLGISDNPVVATLYRRISLILSDGLVDEEERGDLMHALQAFGATDFELGETLKPTNLPLCDPAPTLSFEGMHYCFTGTFSFGGRRDCESAVAERGAIFGSLTRKTNVLVIGSYATESWKHSTFGH
jgi:NAD-dependent DNA ligase